MKGGVRAGDCADLGDHHDGLMAYLTPRRNVEKPRKLALPPKGVLRYPVCQHEWTYSVLRFSVSGQKNTTLKNGQRTVICLGRAKKRSALACLSGWFNAFDQWGQK